MDRRKLRRLLASSSFAALLAAGAARAQTSTNPAGVTRPFLKVDPGETFGVLINFGVISNFAPNPPPGMEVEGNGAVIGDVSNAGSMFIRHTTGTATGIAIDGTNASIGGNVRNNGWMDISADGNGVGLLAQGIVLSGTNTFVDGDEGGAVFNGSEGKLTVDVLATLDDINEAGTPATASAGGTAKGIVVGSDVTLGDRIENEGAIDVGAHIFASASSDGDDDVAAKAKTNGKAYGVFIRAATLPSFQNQHSDEAGHAFIDVKLTGEAKAVAHAVGVRGLANATATASGAGFGVDIKSAGILGDSIDTNGIDHDGLINIANTQHALASAIGEGGSAPLSEATADAKAVASSFGIRASATLLTGGYRTNGTMHVVATASATALADAEAVTGTASASAFALSGRAIAHGGELHIDSLTGGIGNSGLIDVQAIGNAQAKADGFAVDGDANAKVCVSQFIEALGFSAKGTSLAGGYQGSGTVLALATANLSAVATANVQKGNHDASAHALVKSVTASALGVQLEFMAIDGDIANSGGISVAARVIATSTGEAGFVAVAKGTAEAVAQAQATLKAEAIGFSADGSSLDGDLVNDGDIKAVAGIAASGFASAAMNASGFAAATNSFHGVVSAVGYRIGFGQQSGDIDNAGAIDATATIDYQGAAHATNVNGSAVAVVHLVDIFASANGIAVNHSTLNGDFTNSGDIETKAQIAIDAKAVATGADENGVKDEAALALISISQAAARASGINVPAAVFIGGDFRNEGTLVASAVLAIDAVASADAKNSDAAAIVTMLGTTAPEIFAQARGINLQADSIGGAIVNQGQIEAVAHLLIDAEADANSRSKANARVHLDPIVASATGINVTATSLGGGFDNEASLMVSAAVAGLTAEGGLGPLKAVADAEVSTGTSIAAATVIYEGFAGVFGVDLHAQTLNGGVQNSGNISGHALMNVQATAEANNTGVGNGFAEILFDSAQAFSTGIHVSALSLSGGVENDAKIAVSASLLLAAKATAAVGEASATALVIDDAKAANAPLLAVAVGIRIDADTIVGDIGNAGTILANAKMEVSFSVLADAENGIALAELGTSQNEVDLAAFATGLGINVNVGPNQLSGDVFNDGTIMAHAILAIRTEEGGAVGVAAKGSRNANAHGNVEASAGGVGIVVNVVTMTGDLVNSGTIGAEGELIAAIAVLATSNNAVATLDLDLEVSAVGIGASFATGLSGDARNEGQISAHAVAEIGTTSAGKITSVVQATGANVSANLDVAVATASAIGFGIKAGQIGGSVSNAGTIAARAELGLDYAVIADGTSFAQASVHLGSISAGATAMDIAVLNGIAGNVENEGTLIAKAVLQARVEASASNQSKATIGNDAGKGGSDFIGAIARGVDLGAATVSGSVINGEIIDVDATASGAFLAKAALGSASASVALSGIFASAYGVVGVGSSLGGDFRNSGTIAANALARMDMTASAVDAGSVARAQVSLGRNDVSANGLLNRFSTVTGDTLNSGTIAVNAKFIVHLTAEANGDGTAIVAAVASNDDIRAHGIVLGTPSTGFVLVEGSLRNSGKVLVTATEEAGAGEGRVNAFAVGSGTKVSAFATLAAQHNSAAALVANGSELQGQIANSGTLVAQAKATLWITASADGAVTDPLALASFHTNTVTAVGIGVDVGTLGGGVANSGSIGAKAVGNLSAFAAIGDSLAAGSVLTGNANVQARSTSVQALAASLDGVLLEGGIANKGTAIASATLIGDFEARALADGGSVAAQVNVNSPTSGELDANAIGYFMPVDHIEGGFSNDGLILANARLVVGTATDTGTVRATNVGTGQAQANYRLHGLHALAEGVEFDGNDLSGGILNSGAILGKAGLFVDIAATANAHVDGAAQAHASVSIDRARATAVGILLDGATFATLDGGLVNAGTISMDASADLHLAGFASAGEGAGSGAARLNLSDLQVVAAGVFVDSGVLLVNDGLVNAVDGRIRAVASAKFDIEATADGSGVSGGAVASGHTNVQAQAYGLYASALATLNGGMTNSGAIQAKAEIHGAGRAISEEGSVALFPVRATIELHVTAIGLGMDGGTLTGGMLNDGLVMVTAIAGAKATAATGTGIGALLTGIAKAGAVAQATGMHAALSSLNGDIVNDGTLLVKATATGSANGKAGGLVAQAGAFGIFARVTGAAEGGIVNSGKILASATADTPAFAAGIVVAGGIWAEAVRNATGAVIDIQANDPSSAVAVGIQPGLGVVLLDGIENAGLIDVEAIGTSHPFAKAIDLTLNGNGNVVRMVDGTLEARTRSTAAATATGEGTAVAMYLNGAADQLDWSGGLILANIVGEVGVDNLDVFAGVDDVLNFSETIDGLQAIDVNNTSHAATAVEFRINGFVTNVNALNVNENGTLVVGRNANINVNTANFDEDGRVLFELNPGSNNNGVIHANTANLGGTIGVRAVAGLYNDTQSYLVIDANLNGTFDNTEVNTPLLSLAVEQTSPDVVLTVTRNAFASVPGLTHNQNELGEAIDDFYDPVALAGSEIGEVIGELFTLNTDELLDAYDDLHGAEYAQMAYAGFEQMQFMQGGISQRLQDARTRTGGAGQSASLSDQSLQYAAIGADEGIQGTQMASIGNDPDHPGSVWGKGYGSWGTLDGDDEAPGYDRTTGSIVVGLDYRFDSDFLVGIAGAYSFSNMDFDDGDNGDIDSFQIGLFGSWDSGTWYVDGMVSYAFQSYDTERNINFGTIDEKAKADYNGGAAQVYGEVGYQFQVGEQALITPLLGLGWTGVWTEDFKEKGANGANLSIDDASYDSLATTLGVRGSLSLGGFEPSLFLGWRHEFMDDHGEADVAFTAVPDSQWQVIGSDVGSDAGLVGVGLVAEISDQFEVMADYSGQFSGSGSSNTGSIGLRFKF